MNPTIRLRISPSISFARDLAFYLRSRSGGRRGGRQAGRRLRSDVSGRVNPDNNQHSPNENIRVGHFVEGIRVILAVVAQPID